MQVSLFKRKVPYVNADGEQKTATNFFVSCGDVLVPVEVKYFENKETHNQKIYNTFGRQVLFLEVESGRMDGLPDKKKYYLQFKKIWSERYATDCLSAIFIERAETNSVGLDDLQEYRSIVAANDELNLQNSHFQAEISELTKRK